MIYIKIAAYAPEIKEIQMFPDFPDVLNVEQLQEALGVGRSTAYKMLHTNQIVHFYLGRNIKIPKACLVDFVTKSCYHDSIATGIAV